jgi:hypothetical protein
MKVKFIVVEVDDRWGVICNLTPSVYLHICDTKHEAVWLADSLNKAVNTKTEHELEAACDEMIRGLDEG